jgi:hypothetical protein
MDNENLGMKIDSDYSGLMSAGIGYVIIPKDVDVDEYIKDCYLSNTITIYGGYGNQIFYNISIEEDALKRVNFPAQYGDYGSPVIWINIPIHEVPIIIGVLRFKDDKYSFEEQSYRLSRSYKNNHIDFNIRAQKGSVDLNIISGDEPANYTMKVVNSKKNSTISLYCKGFINLHSTDKITLKSEKSYEINTVNKKGEIQGSILYENGKGFTMVDEFGNKATMVDGKINFVSKEINVGDKDTKTVNLAGGKEPVPLGDSLKDELEVERKRLDDVISALQNAQVSTDYSGAGLLATINAGLAKIVKKADYSGVLSKVSKTD